MEEMQGTLPKNSKRLSLSLDFKWICVVLILIIVGMVFFWRPWQSGSNRSISIEGVATIKATPDEFLFSPHFELKGKDKTALNNQMSKKVETIVGELKKLGVVEEDLTLGSYSYDAYYYLQPETGEEIISVDISIKINDRELAQKVSDYLSTTDAQGSLTPYAQFSVEKIKELEGAARDKAIADGKAKAEQSAKGLGAKLGDVLEINESSDLAIPYYGAIAEDSGSGSEGVKSQSGLPILPGQNDYVFRVFMKFEIK